MGRKGTLAKLLNEGPLKGATQPACCDRDGRKAAAELMSALGRKRTLAKRLNNCPLTAAARAAWHDRDGRIADRQEAAVS